MTIEKDWTTAAGLRAQVVMTPMGHRCGYVAVPVGHPLHGVAYSQQTDALLPIADGEPIGKRGAIDIFLLAFDEKRRQSPTGVFNVHGSLTFSGKREGPDDPLHWFGYDCAHCDDSRDNGGQPLDYCIDECESLAKQIVEKTRTN